MERDRTMLEFYSFRGAALVAGVTVIPMPVPMRPPPLSSLRIIAARVGVVACAALAGCASVTPPPVAPSAPPAAPGAPAKAPAAEAPAKSVVVPPPPVNLQGFPPPYQEGFADGCATGRGTEQKDARRFAADGNYRIGWADGLAQCRKK
jgi:hypothetical protein